MATQLAEDTNADLALANDEQSAPRDYEAEARAHGWKSLEEFPGDPEKHVDAETFVKRADEVMPLLKKRDAANRREIDELKKMVKRLTRAEQTAYATALADLKAQQDVAAASGDVAANRAIGDKIEALKDEVREDLPSVHGEDPREQYDSFREANPWYDKANLGSATDTEVAARLFADRLADKLADQGLNKELPLSEFFARIAEETETKFPALKMKTLRPKPASDVAGVTRIPGGPKVKSGVNLPADAKLQATRFHTQGVYGKKTLAEALDAYAKSYDWTV